MENLVGILVVVALMTFLIGGPTLFYHYSSVFADIEKVNARYLSAEEINRRFARQSAEQAWKAQQAAIASPWRQPLINSTGLASYLKSLHKQSKPDPASQIVAFLGSDATTTLMR